MVQKFFIISRNSVFLTLSGGRHPVRPSSRPGSYPIGCGAIRLANERKAAQCIKCVAVRTVHLFPLIIISLWLEFFSFLFLSYSIWPTFSTWTLVRNLQNWIWKENRVLQNDRLSVCGNERWPQCEPAVHPHFSPTIVWQTSAAANGDWFRRNRNWNAAEMRWYSPHAHLIPSWYSSVSRFPWQCHYIGELAFGWPRESVSHKVCKALSLGKFFNLFFRFPSSFTKLRGGVLSLKFRLKFRLSIIFRGSLTVMPQIACCFDSPARLRFGSPTSCNSPEQADPKWPMCDRCPLAGLKNIATQLGLTIQCLNQLKAKIYRLRPCDRYRPTKSKTFCTSPVFRNWCLI